MHGVNWFLSTWAGVLFVFKVLFGIPLSRLFLCAYQTSGTLRSDNSHTEAIPGVFWHTFTSKDRYCACASCIIWGVLRPRPSSCKYFCKYFFFFYIVLLGCKQSVRGLDRSVWLHHLHQCWCVGWGGVSAAVSSLDSHGSTEGVQGCCVRNSLPLCILHLWCDAISIPNCAWTHSCLWVTQIICVGCVASLLLL